PYEDLLKQNKTIMIGDYAGELGNYLLLAPRGIGVLDYRPLMQWDGVEPLDSLLAKRQVTALFLQPRIQSRISSSVQGQEFLADPVSFGWTRIPVERDWM